MDYAINNLFSDIDNDKMYEINGGINLGLIIAGVAGAAIVTAAIVLASYASGGLSNAAIPKSAVVSAYVACGATILTGLAS